MSNLNHKIAHFGILLINKPAGPTSHDIVDKMRRLTKIKKIGHAGTLDPFAEGLLIVLIGRQATRRQADFLKKPKEYLALLKMGFKTDTCDKTGKIIAIYNGILPSKSAIKAKLAGFKGKILQTPPSFSAKKIGGRKAYQLARQGKPFKLEPVKIEIQKIEIIDYQPPLLGLKIKCSAGTYVRSLAHDLGETLGCGAYLEKLIRIKSGSLNIKDAALLKELTIHNWQKYLLPIK